MVQGLKHLKKNNILVIQTAFLGDIVLATAFLQELRKKHPKEEIYFLTTPIGKQILEKNLFNLRIVSFDKRKSDKGIFGFWRMRNYLKSLHISEVYCLHRSVRSVLLATTIGAKSYGFREAALSFLFTKSIKRKYGDHEVEKNFSLLKMNDEHLTNSSGPTLSVQEQIRPFREPYIVVCPGSVWYTKMWPQEYYLQFVKKLLDKGKSVLLLGQKSEEELAIGQTIEKEIEPIYKDKFKNEIGNTSLHELLYFIKESEAVISNDSSPLHIATAFQKKLLAIFGPTTKELGFFPYSNPSLAKVAELEQLNCRPCGAHGHSRCPLGHFQCMKNLTVDMVWKKFLELDLANTK
ncbi:MAG: glycosyltransferase family 9 protein [Oligoflexia bacterium]|nr:glycosyltransferase family 9 protein [Oligoflexia bacterium]